MANSVDLGTKLETIVSELVATGRYNSKSEVLREGVRLVQEREKRLAALDAAIDRGLADAEAGRGELASTVFDRTRGQISGVGGQNQVIVIIMPEAEADLEAIGDWIADDNSSRAISFVQELRSHCESIGESPRASPIILRYRDHEVRRRPYGNYLIFYRLTDERIEILHVLHGARAYDAMLSPEDDA